MPLTWMAFNNNRSPLHDLIGIFFRPITATDRLLSTVLRRVNLNYGNKILFIHCCTIATPKISVRFKSKFYMHENSLSIHSFSIFNLILFRKIFIFNSHKIHWKVGVKSILHACKPKSRFLSVFRCILYKHTHVVLFDKLFLIRICFTKIKRSFKLYFQKNSCK